MVWDVFPDFKNRMILRCKSRWFFRDVAPNPNISSFYPEIICANPLGEPGSSLTSPMLPSTVFPTRCQWEHKEKVLTWRVCGMLSTFVWSRKKCMPTPSLKVIPFISSSKLLRFRFCGRHLAACSCLSVGSPKNHPPKRPETAPCPRKSRADGQRGATQVDTPKISLSWPQPGWNWLKC